MKGTPNETFRIHIYNIVYVQYTVLTYSKQDCYFRFDTIYHRLKGTHTKTGNK